MALAQTRMKWLQRLFSTSHQTNSISGGLALQYDNHVSFDEQGIRTLCVPAQICLPLIDYYRRPLAPLVRAGQSIVRGEAVAQGVLASASGRIIAIEERSIIHPSGYSAPCVVIETDAHVSDNTHSNPTEKDSSANHHSANESALYEPQAKLTTERLALCGVSGLGGAGFSTASKFNAAFSGEQTIKILLINAVECEPVISCDEALVIEQAADIVKAIDALISMTGCAHCIVAIENDKHTAVAALQQALSIHPVPVELRQLTPVYPSGAERALIKCVTGVELSGDQRPVERGIVCINIATALAAHRAQLGLPLTSRIVTIAGDAASHCINVRVNFGTSIKEVLKQTGNNHALLNHRVRVGGPLSGFDLHDLDVPVSATTNCITIEQPYQPPVTQPCIRCGECSEVCPAQLLPQQLYRYADENNSEQLRRFGLSECIECGCCAVVCPSSIPLTQTFRYARDQLREQTLQQDLAAEAVKRYEQREVRLQQRHLAREEKRRLAKARLTDKQEPIADALARARQRRKPRGGRQSVNRDKPQS